MRKSFRPKYKPDKKKKYPANQAIRSLELFIIDENGEKIGVMGRTEALEMASEKGMDLVEVAPNANPPVAKFIDYNKFLYEAEKKKRKEKSRHKKVDTKGIRLSMKISEHDKELRKNQIIGFFEKGHKAKIEMIMRGRENQHKELAKKMLEDFIAKIDETMTVTYEQEINKQGNRLITIIYNKK